MEYASKAVGNAGLVTGIVGSALGALNSGAFNGFGAKNAEDEAITRYEANLITELAKKDHQISLLEADKYTDQKIADFAEKVNVRFGIVEQQLAQQAVYNATANGTIACLQGQVAQLQSLTKLVVPNANVMPGWGNVTITPSTASSGA